VRELNTGTMPMRFVVQYARRKSDVCRRRQDDQQAGEARRAEARRERPAARPTSRKYSTTAVTVPTEVGDVPSGPSSRVKGRLQQPSNFNCLACNMRGHFFLGCPRLDAATKALLNKSYEERMSERLQENQRRPKQTGAASGTGIGLPRLSLDDTPPSGVEAEDLIEEDKSSSKNEQRGRWSRLPRQL